MVRAAVSLSLIWIRLPGIAGGRGDVAIVSGPSKSLSVRGMVTGSPGRQMTDAGTLRDDVGELDCQIAGRFGCGEVAELSFSFAMAGIARPKASPVVRTYSPLRSPHERDHISARHGGHERDHGIPSIRAAVVIARHKRSGRIVNSAGSAGEFAGRRRA